MVNYCLNFKKIKETSLDKNTNYFNGVYWDSIPENSDWIINYNLKIRNKKMNSKPILYINEIIEEHFTQIMYILYYAFINLESGFTGWKPFTKEFLINICEKDFHIYKNNWSNGKEFIDEFPKKINEFINNFCDKVK